MGASGFASLESSSAGHLPVRRSASVSGTGRVSWNVVGSGTVFLELLQPWAWWAWEMKRPAGKVLSQHYELSAWHASAAVHRPTTARP